MISSICRTSPAPLACLSEATALPAASYLRRCSSHHDLGAIFAAAIKAGAHHRHFFANQFAAACSRLGCMDYALHMFDEMPHPNPFVCNAVLRGLSLRPSPLDAVSFYVSRMRATPRVLPTSYAFVALVEACARAHAQRPGEAVHCEVWKRGFRSQVHIQTALLGFYGGIGRVVCARKVFDEMPYRDAFAWTALISVYARSGDMGSAGKLFAITPERTNVAWNAMISGYARARDVSSAAALFAEMPTRDLISWTSMITCYLHNSLHKEAVDTFRAMRESSIPPDELAIAATISSCAHLGAILVGEAIHCYLIQNHFDLNVYVGSSLIDMYAKCGELMRSLMVFFKLRRRNIFCWNAAIDALAVHGRGRDALRLFGLMESVAGGPEPNGVTFVSLLAACNHSGLVEEGCVIFRRMTEDHAIAPWIEHYGCIVDLLGRAGMLQEALEEIGRMEVEPNQVIWGSLLGASRMHGNLEVGQVAIGELAAAEQAVGSGFHALAVNMHAEAGRWKEVAWLREVTKDRGVHKLDPGHSWIEIDGLIHEFVASDRSHAVTDKASLALHDLCRQILITEI